MLVAKAPDAQVRQLHYSVHIFLQPENENVVRRQIYCSNKSSKNINHKKYQRIHSPLVFLHPVLGIYCCGSY